MATFNNRAHHRLNKMEKKIPLTRSSMVRCSFVIFNFLQNNIQSKINHQFKKIMMSIHQMVIKKIKIKKSIINKTRNHSKKVNLHPKMMTMITRSISKALRF